MGECRHYTKSLSKYAEIVIRTKVSNELYLFELPLSALSNRCFFNCLKLDAREKRQRARHTRYQAQTDEIPDKVPKTSP